MRQPISYVELTIKIYNSKSQDLPGYIGYKRKFKIPADDEINYKAVNLCEVSTVPLEVEPPLTEDMDLEDMSQIIEEKGLTFPYLCHSQVRI